VNTYKNMQQAERSLPVLQDALTRDPFNPRIHFGLGSLYLDLERYEDARASLEQSLDIEPAQPNAYINLAGINRQAGDGVGFVQYFLKALEVDPRDHELPGMLADFLYKLELFEEGDDFRDRVMTVAPTSTTAYHIELLRAVQNGDEQAANQSARRAIQDGIENRLDAYSHAVRYLLRSAARTNTVEEEMAWIEEHAPGIFDVDAEAVPQKYRIAQGYAMDAWYTTLPREELLRRLDVILESGRSMGFDLTDTPYLHVNILAMRGEIQEAIEVALSGVFSRSVAVNLGWKRALAQAQFAELVTDPRVQAAMQRWEDEEDALRGQVQTYLADLHAAT
jgi:tetratricopeptide (TPR) repeat protein